MPLSIEQIRQCAHSCKENDLINSLQSSRKGLSSKQAQDALRKFGHNLPSSKNEDGLLQILLRQFNALTFLLIFAAIIAFFIGHTPDAVGISAAALLSIIFGFTQEYKADMALKELYKMAMPCSKALRDGKIGEVQSSLLVPGDIVLLSAGDLIPADCRILDGAQVSVDQSALTGESDHVHKRPGQVLQKLPLAERPNILYSGTLMMKGDATAIVFATGDYSEFGSIASKLAQVGEQQAPLSKYLEELGTKISKASIFAVAVFFILGVFRGEPITQMLIVAISLFVAAVPEGLPTVLAITLALGVGRMAAQKAIVRKMQSVETMGSVNIVCTDKTGTLTENRMQVSKIFAAGQDFAAGEFGSSKAAKNALLSAALCSNASVRISKSGEVEQALGDGTEIAVMLACHNSGINPHSRTQKAIASFAFDHERKRSSAVISSNSQILSYAKGAPEIIFQRCTHILGSDMRVRPLGEKDKEIILQKMEEYSADALRLIAVAYKKMPKKSNYLAKEAESNLVWAGLLGLIDPPRKEVAGALELCQKAGIRVIMLTGDSAQTARAIASRLKILASGSKIILGDEINSLSSGQLAERLKSVSVCARATPEHKFRIVKALQQCGHVVALTGDGVNDAPSIKKADVGIAMGIGGTDVARGAADIVLTDNNFATLVNAIRIGRSIFENIRSFVSYQLTTNVSALSLMFISPVLGMPLPLLPLHILWINVLMDGPPALSLGAEPPAKDIMLRPPRKSSEPFLSKKMVFSIFFAAITMTLITLGIFSFYLKNEPYKAITMAFSTFVFLQLANSLNCRSRTLSAFEMVLSNKWLVFAISVCLIMQLSIVQLGFFEQFFSTSPLDLRDWMLALACSALLLIIGDIYKKLFLPKAEPAQKI